MAEPMPWIPTPPRSEDLPCDDGEPMETARHRRQMQLLIDSLELAWNDRDDFYVAGNMFLYFRETQAKKNDFRGPDVFVVLGTHRGDRRSWVVWEEGGKAPDVVIELVSESTEHVDRGEKMHIYARSLKVGEYFIFDPFSAQLDGYELDAARGVYRTKTPDAAGRLRCDQLELSLAAVQGSYFREEAKWLRWFDADGRELPTPQELAEMTVQRADKEAQRADVEAQRAETEAQRAETEAQRAEAEAQRAEAEAQRADVEAQRAEAEAQRADRLAREVAELRAKLDGR